MTTAFVLSGGGNLGSVQAGQLKAIVEAGVRPDLIVGTSVGAINGAFLAGACHDDGCSELAVTWAELRRSEVFPARPLVGLGGFVGRHSHMVTPAGLRRLLRKHLAFERLEDSPIALHVVACDIRSGEEVLLSRGPAIEAICASAAIPGIFPPVIIDDHVLVDGGIANNAPVSHAIELGADEIWVLPCGYACALTEVPRSAAAVALQSVSLLVHQRITVDISRYQHNCNLRVAPVLCPLNVSPSDFGQSSHLLRQAYEATKQWLDNGTPDLTAMFGFPHRH